MGNNSTAEVSILAQKGMKLGRGKRCSVKIIRKCLSGETSLQGQIDPRHVIKGAKKTPTNY